MILDISLIAIYLYMAGIIFFDNLGGFDGFKNKKTVLRLCQHTNICSFLFPFLLVLNIFYHTWDITNLFIIVGYLLYAYCMMLGYNCVTYASSILRKFRDKKKSPGEIANLKLVLHTGANYFKRGIVIPCFLILAISLIKIISSIM
jgi:hypothetical protein